MLSDCAPAYRTELYFLKNLDLNIRPDAICGGVSSALLYVCRFTPPCFIFHSGHIISQMLHLSPDLTGHCSFTVGPGNLTHLPAHTEQATCFLITYIAALRYMQCMHFNLLPCYIS